MNTPECTRQRGIALDHCVIHVSEWERSNAFYAQVLGAEVVARGQGFTYHLGNVQFNCHGPGVAPHPVAKVPVAPGNSDLCFVWPGSIEESRSHLTTYGVAIELGPAERHGAQGSGTSLYFRDPDGSLLEFIVYSKS